MSEIGATEIVNTPADGETTKGVSSNWAYDHAANKDAHHALYADRGDPEDYDFTEVGLTFDGDWYNLSLASVIPVGTKAVHLAIAAGGESAFDTFSVRKNGNVNAINAGTLIIQVPGVYVSGDFIVCADANRLIGYSGTSGITAVQGKVRGWWI